MTHTKIHTLSVAGETVHWKTRTRGGARPGAGAPVKDEAAGPRVPYSARLSPATVELLKSHAGALSQGEIIDEAVKRWAARRATR